MKSLLFLITVFFMSCECYGAGRYYRVYRDYEQLTNEEKKEIVLPQFRRLLDEKNKFYLYFKLDGEPLKLASKTYEIKTLITIVGEEKTKSQGPSREMMDFGSRSAPQADDEKKIITHDILIPEEGLVSQESLVKLYDIFKDSNARPILVRAIDGFRALSFVWVLWEYLVMKKSEDEAFSDFALIDLYPDIEKRYLFRLIAKKGMVWIKNNYDPEKCKEDLALYRAERPYCQCFCAVCCCDWWDCCYPPTCCSARRWEGCCWERQEKGCLSLLSRLKLC